jgi:hypothetical protein
MAASAGKHICLEETHSRAERRHCTGFGVLPSGFEVHIIVTKRMARYKGLSLKGFWTP